MSNNELHTIYIEDHSGKRFEREVSSDTKLRELANKFIKKPKYSKRKSRAIVELVNRDHPDQRKRLDSELDLHQAGVLNHDTLRVYIELAMRIYLESSLGERIKTEAFNEKLLRDLANEFLEAQGRPRQEGGGRKRRAKVELVNQNNRDKKKQLNTNFGIYDAGVADEGILRIDLESMPETITIYTETLLGQRFKAEVPSDTRLGQLADDFLKTQDRPKKNNRGRRQPAAIELLNPNDPDKKKRLNGNFGIWESGVLSDDTLRIYPESMPEKITIYIETPSDKRFKADLPSETLLRKLISDFESQGLLKKESSSPHQPIVVELVNPSNPNESKRLDDNLDIFEAGLLNDDTLRIKEAEIVIPPDYLPPLPGLFVGYEAQMRRCLEALAPDSRQTSLVIHGIGGCGKSALALMVAYRARQQGQFDAAIYLSAKSTSLTVDGIRQERATFSSLATFVRELARLLGQNDALQIDKNSNWKKTLLNGLRNQRVLIICDSLEELTDEERDAIAEFLQQLPAPNKAMITSRYRLSKSAATVHLNGLTEQETFTLMNEIGRRHAHLATELRRAGETIRGTLYDVTDGNPLALWWALKSVAQRNTSLSQASFDILFKTRSEDLYTYLFADTFRRITDNDKKLLDTLLTYLTPVTDGTLAFATEWSLSTTRLVLERLLALCLVNELPDRRYELHALTRSYLRVSKIEPTKQWFFTFSLLTDAIYVGDRVDLSLRLSPEHSPGSIPLDIHEGEVCFFIQSDKFHLQEETNMVAFTLSAKSHEPLDTTLNLFAQRAGTAKITIEPFYNGQRQPPLRPLSANIRPDLDVDLNNKVERPKLASPIGRRRVRHADLCLRVYARPIDQKASRLRLEYVLYSPHYHFHLPGTPVGSVEVSKNQLSRLRTRVDRLLRRCGENIYERLKSVGQELYSLLFSAKLKKAYEKQRNNIKSWLILSDAEPWIPWELVVPHADGWDDGFLAAKCHLGRWIEGWGASRQAEFPLGPVHFAADAAVKTHHACKEWTDLLAKDDLPRLKDSLFVELGGGYPAALNASSHIWGLHFEGYLERLCDPNRKQELAVIDSQFLPPEELKDYRLKLCQKDPLVTFGMLAPNRQSGLTEIEKVWMPTFIRSGASAFVGPCWATSAECDRLFWRTFYQALWKRVSLGEAVSRGRDALRQMWPDSCDWLAYFLVGDPMARGYIPRPGDGYVTLECLNHDLNEPLPPDKSYSFVATLSMTPPSWYTERRYEVAKDLWHDPQLFVFAPGFEVQPKTKLPLQEQTDDLHTVYFKMKPKRSGECDIFVNFLSNNETRQSLSMSVNVEEGKAK